MAGMTATFARLTLVLLVMSVTKHFATAAQVNRTVSSFGPGDSSLGMHGVGDVSSNNTGLSTQGVGDVSSNSEAGVVITQTGVKPGEMILVDLDIYGNKLSMPSELVDALSLTSDIATLAEPILNLFRAASTSIPAFGAIINFVLGIIVPSTNDIIRKEFENVNQKLDAITLQMSNMKTDILSSTKFHTWFATYTEWEYTIKNGEGKLAETMTLMKQSTDETTKLKLAQAFMDYYREQDVEGATNNILRLTTEDEMSGTRPNILRLFVQDNDCDTEGLSSLMVVIIDIIISSTKQMYAYTLFKYNTPSIVEQRVWSVYQQLYQTRNEFEELLWYCFENTITSAKDRVRNAMVENHSAIGYQLTSRIHDELRRMQAPWYNWAVVQYDKAFSVDVTLCPQVHHNFITLYKKGQQFFNVSNNGRNILVLWQEAEDKNQICENIRTPGTFIPFKLCKGCTNNVIQNDVGFVTGMDCFDYFISQAMEKSYSLSCVTDITAERLEKIIRSDIDDHRFSYIAGEFNAQPNPCEGQGCNGHGTCRSIPYTGQSMCLCEPFYEGPSCENYNDPRAIGKLVELIADLRGNFGSFIGVPDVIDVYLELIQLPEQLQAISGDIMSSIDFNGILTHYGKQFSDAEYIADKYNQLMLQKIEEEQFYQFVKALDFNFDLFFHNLKTLIQGEGILTITEDLLQHYKKSQTHAADCSQSYSTRVADFMKTLLKLDEVVSEVQVRLLLWEAKQVAAVEDQQDIQVQVTDLVSVAKERLGGYVQHWNNTSCPKLSDDADMDEQFCNEKSSYNGQEVTIHCRNDKVPIPATVTCQRKEGQLEWSALPRCLYLWSPWGSWSGCSKPCDSGIMTRTRRKLNNETDTETESCNTQRCCISRNGKFKCSNNRCISESRLCDGRDDCGNGDDEIGSRCSYLRSGETIALKNMRTGSFMCGYGDWPHWDYVQFKNCPGSIMSGQDWSRCSLEAMDNIVAAYRSTGEAIRYGDTVRILFRDGYWIKNIQKKEWTIIGKPGSWSDGYLFRIYATNRKGSCSYDPTISCTGDPIQPRDKIILLDRWGNEISGDDSKWVSKNNCIQKNITMSCSSAKWELFVKR